MSRVSLVTSSWDKTAFGKRLLQAEVQSTWPRVLVGLSESISVQVEPPAYPACPPQATFLVTPETSCTVAVVNQLPQFSFSVHVVPGIMPKDSTPAKQALHS